MKHIFTQKEDNFIKDNYSTMTMKEIAENLNLTDAQIRHRIQRHLKIKPSKQRKHFVNQNYFKEWSNNMAYILGLIAADGNIYDDGYRNKGKISISLCKNDRALLEQIAIEIGTDIGAVKDRSNCNQSDLTIYNIEMYKDLVELGITERKSLTLLWLKNIPEDKVSHFLRGYYDGDGSITLAKQSKNSYKAVIQFLGTKDFLQNISKEIEKHVGIKKKEPESTQTRIMCLRYRTRQARDILDWMYEGSEDSFYMSRKYEKYLSHKNNVQRLSPRGVGFSESEMQGSVLPI